MAIEEPAFLAPVERHVGGVEVEDDLPRRRIAMGLEETVNEQPLDRRCVMGTAMGAAGRADKCVLLTVQRRLAGKGRAVAAPGRELAGQDGQHRVVAAGRGR